MLNPQQPLEPHSSKASGLRGRLRRWLADRFSVEARAERDEALRSLHVVRGHLKTLFEQAGEGLLVCDVRGQVLLCNSQAERLLDTRRSEIVGRPLSVRLQQGASESAMPLRTGEATVFRDGAEPVPIEVRVHEVPGPDGKQWLIQLHDLSDRRQAQERLEKLANFDSLTGLPNRALFRDRLAQAMKRAQRSSTPMALMFLDLDRFKVVNDSLGHEVGDRLLQHVARTITDCLRSVDSVARLDHEDPYLVSRLGGDEFTVIAEGIAGAEDAALVAQRLLEALNSPFIVGDEEIIVSASIGITTYPTDDVDLDTLLRHTDMAMYRAKSSGRDTYCFFSDDLNASVSARLSMEGSLRRALERDEFALHYQPKADLKTGEVTCVETLIRWHCPGRGLVPPDRFIAVLEDTGLILQVGAWVIRTACAQLATWDREGMPPLRLAINVSARQFRHPFLVALVEDTLRECGIEPGRIEIELTESLLMEDTEVTRGMLANFARIGLRLALDDFGTGHSSLAYLKRFRIDTLKIDRSFVTALPDAEEDRAIAGAVVALGHSMGMTVVAEGVETQAQCDILRDLGCDEIQGYLLSPPLAPPEFCQWMQARQEQAAVAHLHWAQALETVTPITLAHAPSKGEIRPQEAVRLAAEPAGAVCKKVPPAPVVHAKPPPTPVADPAHEGHPGIRVWSLSQMEQDPSARPARQAATVAEEPERETALAGDADADEGPRRLTAAQRAVQAGAQPPPRRRWMR